MTVTSQTSSASYSGNGVTTDFTVPFRLLADTDLQVILIDADGTEHPQTIVSNYTVSGTGGTSGTVSMLAAPAIGQQLDIFRDVPLTQEKDYTTGDKFPAESHEQALDKLTMIDQQHGVFLSRAWLAPRGVDGGLITAGDEGTVAKFDADGNIVAGPSLTDIEAAADNAAAAAASAVDAASSAANAETAQTAAEAAAAAAEAAAAGVTLPAAGDNQIMVDIAHVRVLKTYAEVRALLDVPEWSDLWYMDAANYGVSASNTAAQNATALNALIAALPSSGANIFIKGPTPFDSTLNLKGKQRIRFFGLSDINSAGGSSALWWQGTTNGNAIDLRSSLSCGFEGVDLIHQFGNNAWTGKFINFDRDVSGGGGDTNFPFIRDCLLSTAQNPNMVGLSLDGAVDGVFERVNFAGAGKPIWGKQAAAQYSNVMDFIHCRFGGYNNYLVFGIGEHWSFRGGYVQACVADAVGRFIYGATQGNTALDSFLNLLIENVGFYDVTGTGTVWLQNMRGRGLRINLCQFSAAQTAFAMILDAVQGFEITSNQMLGASGAATVLVGFGTAPTGLDPTNHGSIKNNALSYGNLIGSLTTAQNDIDIAQNYSIPGGSPVLWVQKPMNVPTSAQAGVGIAWKDAAASNVIKSS